MIKICFVIDSMKIGGAEKLTFDVIANLNKRKFNVTIIALFKVDLSESLRDSLDPGIKIIELEAREYGYLSRLKILWNIIKEFDIVHSCLETSNLYCSTINFFKKFNYVISIHGVDGVFFEKGANVSFKYVFLIKHVQTFLFRFVKNFIAVSNDTKNFLVSKRKVKSDKIVVVYHGLDLSKYTDFYDEIKLNELRKNYGLRKTDFIISYIGRFASGKGLLELIDNIKSILLENSNVKLMLVGDGTEYSKMSDLIKLNKLNDSTIFTGYQHNVIPYFHLSDLLILPSFSEGIPISILEAMYYKRLVLSSSVGGIPEVIIDDQNGFLFPKGDFLCMKKKILQIINEKKSCSDIRSEAKTTIEKKFDLRMNIHEIENYFQKIIELNG